MEGALQSLKRFFNPSMVDLAIDLGTQNLLISDKLQVIYNEATLVAQTDSTRGISYGHCGTARFWWLLGQGK